MDIDDAPDGHQSSQESVFDAIVVGAGITGLVSASILREQGTEKILVVDHYDQVGGNHIDCHINGYSFDVGSLVFQDDSPLLRHFPELLEQYLPIDPSWGKLTPQGAVTDYPFSVKDDVVAAGPLEWCRILLSVASARIVHRRLNNARDFARYWIGARLLHRSGLEHYMERFCGLPAERIDLSFAEKRMLWISEQAALKNLSRRILPRWTRTEHGATNQQLARPRAGFAELYRPAVQRLQSDGVTFCLSAEMASLDVAQDTFVLQLGDRTVTAKRVISTIPIDHIRDLCGISAADRLPVVTLISLFFSFAGRRGFSQSIFYNFSHDGSWKRLTMYSDFYGPVHDREYFAVEVIAGAIPQTIETEAQRFMQHTSANGLFIGDLHLEGSHVLSNAYPIYTNGAGEQAATGVAQLRALGIESFGRQGGFEYQPTARVSTQVAEKALAGVAPSSAAPVSIAEVDQ